MARRKNKHADAAQRPATSLLQIRTTGEEKEAIRRAAKALGISISDFVIATALEATNRVPTEYEMPDIPSEHAVWEVPDFFRHLCERAAQGDWGGYALAGYELVHRWRVIPPVFHEDEVEQEKERADQWDAARLELASQVELGNEYGIVKWFNSHFPACMELVPARRWTEFARGVAKAYQDNHEIDAYP